MRKEDNRFDVAAFLVVSALSFLGFSTVLFLLQKTWNKHFLTIAGGLAAAALLVYLAEKIHDAYFRKKQD